MDDKKTPLFSVIVPVYNAEKTISSTIESILGQSFRDFELILVNDGSRDDSLTICKDFARNDSRIRVLNYPNGGVSSARNHGLECAKGVYICFVDADDIVRPDWLKSYSQFTTVDLMVEGHISIKDNEKEEVTDENSFFSNCNYIYGIEKLCEKGRLNMPWNKCYKRSIINERGLRFMLGCDLYEDLIFSLQYIQNSHSLQIVSYCGYEYQRFNSTLTHKFNNLENYVSWCEKIMEEVEVLTQMYNCYSTRISQLVYTSIFVHATWFLILYYGKFDYYTRNKLYVFINNNKNLLISEEVPTNRMFFGQLSNKNRFIDFLIGVESLIIHFILNLKK